MDPVAIFKRRHLYWLLFFGVFILAAILALIVLGLAITKEVQELKVARADQIWLNESLTRIADLSRDKEKAEVLLSGLEKTLPLNVEVPSKVFTSIKAIAKSRGLTAEVAFGAERSGEGIDFVLRTNGSLKNIKEYIDDLETQKMLIQFSLLELTKGAGSLYGATLQGFVATRKP